MKYRIVRKLEENEQFGFYPEVLDLDFFDKSKNWYKLPNIPEHGFKHQTEASDHIYSYDNEKKKILCVVQEITT